MVSLRPCIAELGPGALVGSSSHAQLAYSNEVTGRNMFRCSTIQREGWCLGAECELYRRRGGSGAEPLTGVTGAKAPLGSSGPVVVAGSSAKQSTNPYPSSPWGPLPLPLGRERSRLKRAERRVAESMREVS